MKRFLAPYALLLGLLTAVWLLTNCRADTAVPLPTPAAIAHVPATAKSPTATAKSPTATAESPTATAESPIATAAPTEINSLLPPTNTPQSTSQPTNQPTATLPATFTPQPTPTPAPTIRPFATLAATPPTAVPTPMPPFVKSDAITNIVLVGNDVAEAQGGRTDSIILVSINREQKTATLLSIPRDLYVFIPGWRMTKINLALPHGHAVDYPGAGGGLLKDTIEYNLGLPVDYYARIGFDGFKDVVDAIGGVEIVVTCALRDWRLAAPDLDPNVEESWEMFTLEPGVYEIDGDLALWYARSRRTTNDFERGRRQQQVLQAILNRGIDSQAILNLPDLWRVYRDAVETDLTLPVALELAALAPAVRDNGVQHLSLAGDAVRSWREPDTGWSMQLLEPETAVSILRRVMQPPALNRATRPPIIVEIATADPILYRQLAENLIWYGFVPRHLPTTDPPPTHTRINFFGPNLKGANSDLLSWLFQQSPTAISLNPEVESDATYRVYPGYDSDPCLPSFAAPWAENQ